MVLWIYRKRKGPIKPPPTIRQTWTIKVIKLTHTCTYMPKYAIYYMDNINASQIVSYTMLRLLKFTHLLRSISVWGSSIHIPIMLSCNLMRLLLLLGLYFCRNSNFPKYIHLPRPCHHTYNRENSSFIFILFLANQMIDKISTTGE